MGYISRRRGAHFVGVLTVIFFMFGCGVQEPAVRIGINPWPGYDLLYLAEQKGFFEEAGLHVRIVQYSSLADVQRAFAQGQIDGMGSTLIELVQVAESKPVAIGLIADYSNGADVILAKPDIDGVLGLKDQPIGLELHSLGVYILARALALNGLTLEDVKYRNVEQLDLEEACRNKEIVAAVTYPPTSINLQNDLDAKVIFDSSMIPGEVVDLISFDREILAENPQFQRKLRAVWARTLSFLATNRQEALAVIAEREQISVADLEEVLKEIKLVRSEDQASVLDKHGRLPETITLVSRTLQKIGLTEQEIAPESLLYEGGTP